ncbi:MAG: PIG-L family deacetylase [Betaproteobacteria bacterium]|nr:PIG-L family deacetylase [Betaproteobacteria bacterium]
MKNTFKSRVTKTILLGILLPVSLLLVALILSPQYFKTQTQTLSFAEPPKTVLVVFAHPDDEVTNAGLIRHFTDSGAEVALLTLSDGSANPNSDMGACSGHENISDCRIQELRTAATLLGIKNVITPMLPDSALYHHMPQAIEHISEAIRTLRPEVILTMEPSGLNQQEDHRTLFPAVAKSIQNTGHSAQLLLSTLPWPVSLFLPSQLPPSLSGSLRIFETSAPLREVKAKVAEAHKSQSRTIQGLTLGLGPALLFRWLNFETYSVVGNNDLTVLLKQ